MSLPWFRMYAEAVDNDKLRLLAFEDRWHYVALLCCKTQGILDGSGELMRRRIAVKLGVQVRELDEIARRLAEVDLIDQKTLQPTGWDGRQFRSDADPTNAERQKRWRERNKKNKDIGTSCVTRPLRNGHVTRRDTDSDADKEEEKEEKAIPKTAKPDRWEIPNWINVEAWAEFEQHRRDIRQPLTNQARTKAANQLQGLTPQQQQACIDKSIQARWAGLFPEKKNAAHSQPSNESRAQRAARVGAEIDARARRWVSAGTVD
jgi:hypothetical protein